jgi:alpha-beta hydrolase superfamily lysophospholipase
VEGSLAEGEHYEDAISALPIRKRVVLEATVATDMVLRTGLASAVSAAGLPWVFSSSAREERGRLAFYRELAQTGDAKLAFPPPPQGIKVESRRASRGVTLRFHSPYVAQARRLRSSYSSFTRNRVGLAQHWTHDDGPRPTLCVIHGFGASLPRLNSAFFALPWFFDQGYDVLMYLMPFHGSRGDPGPLDGAGLFAHGIAHLNEGIAQAVHDFRVFLDYLEGTGVEKIGVTGLSLGGYLSSLLAAVDDRLQVVIPNAPVTSIAPLVRGWFPANFLIAAGLMGHRIPFEEVEEAIAVHSPLNYPAVVEKDRLMIIGGLGDRLAPPEQSSMLWEHWGRPRLHWFPGNHVIHVDRGAYIGEMRRFMAAANFEPESR